MIVHWQNGTRKVVSSCSGRTSLENEGSPSLLDYELSKETKDAKEKQIWKETSCVHKSVHNFLFARSRSSIIASHAKIILSALGPGR